MRLSITLRLSLLFAVLSTLALAGTGFYLYGTLARQFAERDTADLVGKVELVRHLISEMRSRDEVVSSRRRLYDALVGHANLHLALYDRDGEVLFATSRLRLPAAQLATAFPASDVPRATAVWEGPAGLRFRTLAAWGELAVSARQQALIALALDISAEQALLAAHRRNIMIALAVAGVAVAMLGFAVARRGLRPIHDMTRAASRISASHLSERLDEARVPPELRQLASAFNAMLARLEDSFSRLAGFSSDLAHELRTPIHNLLMHAQVALSRARSAAEYREVLESNLEEYGRLARIFEDMLFLARADQAQTAVRRECVDLRAEIDKVAEFYDALAMECGVTIRCAGEGMVAADRLMVQRAISNLFSNAIRHAPRDGMIEAVVQPVGEASVRLAVSNPGLGIPEECLPRIFDRFYRVDRLGSGVREGSGLGLAIVRSIMQLHGGTVTVESIPDRITTFMLNFPVAPRASAAESPNREKSVKGTFANVAAVTIPAQDRHAHLDKRAP